MVGNPNCGKTTLFNKFTGLNHKVGNFPGVTVEKKSGILKLRNKTELEIIDLPGCYSLSSTSPDEKVVQDVLLNPNDEAYPDIILVVVDVTNLKRNLFLATQIIDLGIPVIIAFNMEDIAKKRGLTVDLEKMKQLLGVPVFSISAKKDIGLDNLYDALSKEIPTPSKSIIDAVAIGGKALQEIQKVENNNNSYQVLKKLNNHNLFQWLEDVSIYEKAIEENDYNRNESELHEINNRYEFIVDTIEKSVTDKGIKAEEDDATEKLDKIITHPFWGFFIFLGVFFLLFQSVFTIADYPMQWIENGMGLLSESISNVLPKGLFSSFITDGLLAGIGGILVFLPLIMILFGLITILEDSGYLSRVSFMSDRLLRSFGMNGKSVIPLVGGFACAVPAIMAARNIESKRERLITIFITPLMSCSARLPVYAFLTAFIVPDEMLGGFISLQALFMMGLYLLGIVFSLLIAAIINKFMIKGEKSTFLLELPKYGIPTVKNVFSTMINKGKTFIIEAGKIILIASVILWLSSSFGPPSQMERIENKYNQAYFTENFAPEKIELLKSAEKLEYSYIGYVGKAIEPAIRPLGFDWKVGIALITSFAAREVFVGAMNTIYSVEGGELSKDSMTAIKFTIPTAFSLLIFYVFALQCMSTVAIAKQETGKWKFAITQFFVFTGIAYLGSLITFQLLS